MIASLSWWKCLLFLVLMADCMQIKYYVPSVHSSSFILQYIYCNYHEYRILQGEEECTLPKEYSIFMQYSIFCNILYSCNILSNFAISILFANSLWPPLMKILTHQLHLHTLTWWRTVVHHLCLYKEGWSMSVQVWVLALSTKMYLHTHTTGTVSSVASQIK